MSVISPTVAPTAMSWSLMRAELLPSPTTTIVTLMTGIGMASTGVTSALAGAGSHWGGGVNAAENLGESSAGWSTDARRDSSVGAGGAARTGVGAGAATSASGNGAAAEGLASAGLGPPPPRRSLSISRAPPESPSTRTQRRWRLVSSTP